MKDCPDKALLRQYAAGACGYDLTMECDRHLETCDACAAFIAAESQLWAEISEGGSVDPGPEFWGDFSQSVMARIESASETGPARRELGEETLETRLPAELDGLSKSAFFTRPQWAWVGTALAAAAVFLVIFMPPAQKMANPPAQVALNPVDLEGIGEEGSDWLGELDMEDWESLSAGLLATTLTVDEAAVLNDDEYDQDTFLEDLNDEEMNLLVASIENGLSG